MMTTLITNSNEGNLRDELFALSADADRINVAVAFFSASELLRQWDSDGIKINLIVSLRPPTSYYSLREIQSCLNIDINFLGPKFHSKFILFYNKKELIGSVIGSSNFTSGGLEGNIETNIYIKDHKFLLNLNEHFQNLLEDSHLLQPSDLDQYKSIYDNYIKNKKKTDGELNNFESNTIRNRKKRGKQKACKEARLYFEYWRTVDEVRELIKNYSDKYFPKIPYYLVLDCFWHWVKAIWHKETGKSLNRRNQRKEIPKLFLAFAKSDLSHWPKDNLKRSKSIFQLLLSIKKIESLTKNQALEVFSNLHSTSTRIQRFGADEDFKSENSITAIRSALKYLLYSNDEMDWRIHNLIKTGSKLKLHHLGPSGVQEINGWTRPDTYPIRNEKANKALELLGYDLEKEG